MRLTLARCFLIVAVAVVPIRMSMSELGRWFWYGFGYEWLWFFWVIGFASEPDRTMKEVATRTIPYEGPLAAPYWAQITTTEHVSAAELGGCIGFLTNIFAVIAFLVLVGFAWYATGAKRSED